MGLTEKRLSLHHIHYGQPPHAHLLPLCPLVTLSWVPTLLSCPPHPHTSSTQPLNPKPLSLRSHSRARSSFSLS